MLRFVALTLALAPERGRRMFGSVPKNVRLKLRDSGVCA